MSSALRAKRSCEVSLKLDWASCRSVVVREKYANTRPVRRTTKARTMIRAAPFESLFRNLLSKIFMGRGLVRLGGLAGRDKNNVRTLEYRKSPDVARLSFHQGRAGNSTPTGWGT